MVRRETWDKVVLKRKILTVSMFVIEEKKKKTLKKYSHIHPNTYVHAGCSLNRLMLTPEARAHDRMGSLTPCADN